MITWSLCVYNSGANKTGNFVVEQKFEPTVIRNLYGFLRNLGIDYILGRYVYLLPNDTFKYKEKMNYEKLCRLPHIDQPYWTSMFACVAIVFIHHFGKTVGITVAYKL